MLNNQDELKKLIKMVNANIRSLLKSSLAKEKVYKKILDECILEVKLIKNIVDSNMQYQTTKEYVHTSVSNLIAFSKTLDHLVQFMEYDGYICLDVTRLETNSRKIYLELDKSLNFDKNVVC